MTDRPVIDIDVSGPVLLLDVDNSHTDVPADIYDNGYFKFCADDVDADVPTYDMFEIGPDEILPAGTVVRMNYLWGHQKIGGLSEPTDYQVTLPKDAPVKRAVLMIISAYYVAMKKNNGHGRYFYIEQVSKDEDGVVQITWGS